MGAGTAREWLDRGGHEQQAMWIWGEGEAAINNCARQHEAREREYEAEAEEMQATDWSSVDDGSALLRLEETHAGGRREASASTRSPLQVTCICPSSFFFLQPNCFVRCCYC